MPGMRLHLVSGAAAALIAAAGGAPAQTPAAPRAVAAPAASAVEPAAAGGAQRGGEPNVRRFVMEDDANRVEELSIRGQTRRVVVTTKGPLASTYEIGTGDPSREASAAADPRRGTIGQRMWRLFDF